MTPKLAPPVKKNAFVHKLYSMLKNPKLSKLIWWTGPDDSNTFALYPSKEFADVLLEYFKHGNVASFVRQLHMYGFHKILDPQLAYHDKELPIWEFRHLLGKFKKNDELLLVYIKRRLLLNALRNLLLLENENQHQHQQPQPHPHHPHHQEQYEHPPVVYYPPPRPQAGGPYAYYGPVPAPQWPHPNQPNHLHHQPYQYQPQVYHPPPIQGLPPHPQGPPNLPQPALAPYATPMLPPPPFAASEAKSTPKLPPQPVSHSPLPKRRSLDAVRPPVLPLLHPLPHLRYSHSTSLLPTFPPSGSEAPRLAPAEDTALQFRRPWESISDKRPRNPSLLFDPLAPSRPDAIKLPPLVPPSTGSPQQGSQTPSNPILRGLASSIPIRKSVYDKLRPLLIELHLAHNAPGSISTPPRALGGHNFDLIGLNLLLIFLGASSISSLSSGTRSLFGLILYLIDESRKPSLVAPHERPGSPSQHARAPRATLTIAEEEALTESQTVKPENASKASTEEVGQSSSAFSLSTLPKPLTPLFKAKVSFLLDDLNGVKRQKIEAEPEATEASQT